MPASIPSTADTTGGAVTGASVISGLGYTPVSPTALTTAVGANALDFSIGTGQPGVLSNGQKLLIYPLSHAITLPASLAGSSGVALTAATASSAFVFAYKRSGATTTIATFTFAASGTAASISGVVIPTLAAGDVLLLTAPATADTTLADVGFSILGVRQ